MLFRSRPTQLFLPRSPLTLQPCDPANAQSPDQRSSPCPLHWEHGALTTGPPGKSPSGLCLGRFVLAPSGTLTLMSRSLPLASMTTQCLHLLCPWLFLFLSFFLNSLSRGLLCYSFPFAVRAQQDVPPHVPPVFLGWAPWLLNRCPGTPGAGPCLPRGCPAAGRVFSGTPALYAPEAGGAPCSDWKT